jgi:hypothetical protein
MSEFILFHPCRVRKLAACGLLVLAFFWAESSPAADNGNPDGTSWSFKPVARPTPPPVRDSAWVRDEIDRFILARLEAAGLKPNPDADRYTLIRRAAFDLTGLPPTEQEIALFVSDPAALDLAFTRVVDGYLKSPRLGERWARHWLDVARYADSVGRTWNAPFNYAWRYRDYVIDAFNSDKPYDRFVLEQIAGDLLPARSIAEERENRIATGFLALGAVDIYAEGRLEAFILDQVDEQIDVTTRAFLGLSWSCARCHDHKYESISQKDYYSLAGIFYSTQTWTGQFAKAVRPGRYVDGEALLVLRDLRTGQVGASTPGTGIHSMDDARRLGNQPFRYTTDPNLAMGVTEGTIRACAIRKAGNPYDRGLVPPRGTIDVPGLPRLPSIPAMSSGRLELAGWIASGSHPLTARVMANRVWQHLFGRGIVRTVDDFGSTGEAPSHPELLYHLAARFVDNGWSVKKLIRSIMLSRAYRQSSAGDPAKQEKDPLNDLFWRMDLRRLEVEPIRDALLAAAGTLTLDRPDGIQVTGYGGARGVAATRSLLPLDAPYRTVYLPVLRSALPQMHEIFDFPEPCQIQGQRQTTTVAPQGLFFMNSPFVVQTARAAAGRLLLEKPPDRLRQAYLRLLGREPAPAELKSAGDFLASVKPAAGDTNPDLYRWTTFVQVLMASAEFRYVK